VKARANLVQAFSPSFLAPPLLGPRKRCYSTSQRCSWSREVLGIGLNARLTSRRFESYTDVMPSGKRVLTLEPLQPDDSGTRRSVSAFSSGNNTPNRRYATSVTWWPSRPAVTAATMSAAWIGLAHDQSSQKLPTVGRGPGAGTLSPVQPSSLRRVWSLSPGPGVSRPPCTQATYTSSLAIW